MSHSLVDFPSLSASDGSSGSESDDFADDFHFQSLAKDYQNSLDNLVDEQEQKLENWERSQIPSTLSGSSFSSSSASSASSSSASSALSFSKNDKRTALSDLDSNNYLDGKDDLESFEPLSLSPASFSTGHKVLPISSSKHAHSQRSPNAGGLDNVYGSALDEWIRSRENWEKKLLQLQSLYQNSAADKSSTSPIPTLPPRTSAPASSLALSVNPPSLPELTSLIGSLLSEIQMEKIQLQTYRANHHTPTAPSQTTQTLRPSTASGTATSTQLRAYESHLERKLSSSTSTISSLQSSVSSLTARLSSLHSQLSATQTRHAEELSSLQTRLNQAENDRNRWRIEALEKEKKATEWQREARQRGDAASEDRRKSAQLSASLATAERRLIDLSAALESAQCSASSQREQLLSLVADERASLASTAAAVSEKSFLAKKKSEGKAKRETDEQKRNAEEWRQKWLQSEKSRTALEQKWSALVWQQEQKETELQQLQAKYQNLTRTQNGLGNGIEIEKPAIHDQGEKDIEANAKNTIDELEELLKRLKKSDHVNSKSTNQKMHDEREDNEDVKIPEDMKRISTAYGISAQDYPPLKLTVHSQPPLPTSAYSYGQSFAEHPLPHIQMQTGPPLSGAALLDHKEHLLTDLLHTKNAIESLKSHYQETKTVYQQQFQQADSASSPTFSPAAGVLPSEEPIAPTNDNAAGVVDLSAATASTSSRDLHVKVALSLEPASLQNLLQLHSPTVLPADGSFGNKTKTKSAASWKKKHLQATAQIAAWQQRNLHSTATAKSKKAKHLDALSKPRGGAYSFR